MRILCVIDSLGSGGAQRQLVELAQGFKERGHDVLFLTYHENNFFKPKLDDIEIPVFTLIETNYLKRIFKVRSFIRKTKPDSVIAFLQGASFMATIAGFPCRKWKLIVGERSANPNILKSFKLRLYRWFHLFSDYVVANSYSNLNLVKRANPLINKEKQIVIYNMVNIPSNLALTKSKVKSSKTLIVVAASYRPVKNLDGLIAAVSTLELHHLNQFEIHWYGNAEDVEYEKQMRELIIKNNLENIIKLHSSVKDIYQKYIESDFVALFSHYEGFPNTICEAMALGKPILVTNISDLPKFIKEQINGYICKSMDIQSIQKAILSAIGSTLEEREKMGHNNKILANKYFSKEVVVDKYMDLLLK